MEHLSKNHTEDFAKETLGIFMEEFLEEIIKQSLEEFLKNPLDFFFSEFTRYISEGNRGKFPKTISCGISEVIPCVIYKKKLLKEFLKQQMEDFF